MIFSQCFFVNQLCKPMIKFVYCVRRHPSLSPQEFREYWLERHAPLVKSCAAVLGARRYVQSHTLDTELNVIAAPARGRTDIYDGITELWWDKIEDVIAAHSTPAGQEVNRRLAEDEARFCDLSRSCVFFTEEHAIF